jgi:hypothetical protein
VNEQGGNASEMAVVGGPFDFKVVRDGPTISLTVVGNKGDIVTQIDFRADRIDNVIRALLNVRNT